MYADENDPVKRKAIMMQDHGGNIAGSKSLARRDWMETEAQMEGLALAARKDSSLLAAGGKLGVGGRCRRR